MIGILFTIWFTSTLIINYHTCAIISQELYILNPFFSSVWNQELLVLNNLYTNQGSMDLRSKGYNGDFHKRGSTTSSRWVMHIVYKYTQKTPRRATLKYLVFYNKKNMEGCTQLILVLWQVCGNSVNPISVVPDWKVPWKEGMSCGKKRNSTLYFYNNEPSKNKHFLILLSSLARNSKEPKLKRIVSPFWENPLFVLFRA